MGSQSCDQRLGGEHKMRILAVFALTSIIGSTAAQELSEAAQLSQEADDQRTWNGNTNFNGLGNFGNFGDLFTNQNIGTWYALLAALLIVPLFLALLAGGSGGLGGLGGLFGNRRQSFLNRVAQGSGNVPGAFNNRPQTFVPTVGESLLLAYIQSANDLYGPMLQG